MASLQPKTGVLGKRLAAHLLRRTTFAITPARIADFATKTVDEAIAELFTFPPLYEPNGPVSTTGTHWLTMDSYSTHDPFYIPRNAAVIYWYTNEIIKDVSIRHKMALFFRNIFVTSPGKFTDWHKFDNERLFQYYALGNIKTLAYKVTLDNQMLMFLNNDINTKGQPNENYAREFLELFTILKGTQIGAENYTNYTEHDIREAARVLTGFTTGDFDHKDPETGLATGVAEYNNHDLGNKQFTGAFQNRVINGANSQADMFRELEEFVDMVFDQLETAKAYVRRLYLYFVHDIISPEIESDIIEPLATQLYANGYEVTPVLETLLKSAHFFDEDDSDHTDNIIGGKIKSPLEMLYQSVHLFDADKITGPFISDNEHSRDIMANFYQHSLTEIGYGEYPTSVEGYPGFFKSPVFSKNWINTTFLAQRNKMERCVRTGQSIAKNGRYLPFGIDSITDYFDAHYTNQEYADLFLTQVLEVMFPELPLPDRFDYFRDKLLGGLSPVNWMFEWLNYKATGDDSAVKIVLEDLYVAIFKSSEFQTF